MKHVFTILLLTFALTLCAISQTELWRLPGTYSLAVKGDGDNIFLAHGGWPYSSIIPDTIKKIDPAGSILKQVESSYPISGLLYNGTGVYSLFSTGTNYDSITYFDNNLNILWGKSISSGIRNNFYNPALDKAGNIYLIVTNPISLMKITPQGQIAFRKSISRPLLKTNIMDEQYTSPIIDSTGKIYIVCWFADEVTKESMTSYSSMYNGYYYLYKTDTTTSTQFTQTVILKKDKFYLGKGNDRGDEAFNLDDPTYLLNNITLQNGKIILGGTYNYSLVKNSTSSKEEYLSQWRMMVVGTDGKVKKFSYKGKGIDACKEPGYSIKSDQSMNYLSWLGGGSSDIVSLVGITARNKVVCSNGELYQDGVVMGYNTATKKIVWKVVMPDVYFGNAYSKVSGKIIAGISASSYQVFDANGNIGSILSFPDYTKKVKFVEDINKTDDVLYLNRSGSSGDYFAKYSLPAMQFTPSTFSSYVEEPMQFELKQNYPNPFNPATTIEFAIPQASFVTLKIYNMLGQEVATVLNRQDMEEGYQEVEFNAGMLASGVYFYKLEADGYATEEGQNPSKYTEIKKMMLMK
ncbi:MAG: T9SS type A sorting domain-containing protein [Ignavibacteriales bacterium]|nr:T9SS type A sorting domain-containing protein [Ignavibacteriales bacterium]